MQVSVESVNKLERRVTVVVPVEKVEQAYNNRIHKLAKTAKVKGFRSGKVPLDYIKQLHGQKAREEALSEIIQSSLYAAMNQEKLSPVGVPVVEPKNIVPGQPLEFVATFEVLPPMEPVMFNLAQIEKHTATITDADITNVLNKLRQQHVTWQKVDRVAQVNDQVIIDFRGSMNGEVFAGGEAHDYPIVLGSKTMIAGFEEGLLGMKTGEEKTLHLTFPENYFAKEFAGKIADFAVKMIKVSEPILPELNDAFGKKLGIKNGDIDELRIEIRKNLQRELDRIIKAKLKKQVFDALLQQNHLEIPKALIEQEAKRIHNQLHPHHADAHDHGHTPEEMAKFNEAAKTNVALGLLIAQLVKQHNMALDRERFQAHVNQLSSVYENPAEVLKWYTSNKQAKAEAEMQVLEEQVTEKLLEGVPMTEKILSYDELLKSLQ